MGSNSNWRVSFSHVSLSVWFVVEEVGCTGSW